jgi:hypothetical protein
MNGYELSAYNFAMFNTTGWQILTGVPAFHALLLGIVSWLPKRRVQMFSILTQFFWFITTPTLIFLNKEYALISRRYQLHPTFATTHCPSGHTDADTYPYLMHHLFTVTFLFSIYALSLSIDRMPSGSLCHVVVVVVVKVKKENVGSVLPDLFLESCYQT